MLEGPGPRSNGRVQCTSVAHAVWCTSAPFGTLLPAHTQQITKAEEELLGPDDELPIDLRVRGRVGRGLKFDPQASCVGARGHGAVCSPGKPLTCA